MTESEIRATVARMTSGSAAAKKALLQQALAGDASALFALRFWAKRVGVIAS